MTQSSASKRKGENKVNKKRLTLSKFIKEYRILQPIVENRREDCKILNGGAVLGLFLSY
jgi:hypothetical protein